MNEVIIEEMYTFMTFAQRQESRGKIFPAALNQFKDIFLRINNGCACTKRNREQHAEVTYKNSMLMLSPIDQHELKIFLGIGEEYSKATIKDKGVFLLELDA
jgi:hypothetical protein